MSNHHPLDFNGDGRVTISDAFSLVGQLASGRYRSHNGIDMNGDGRVDFQDGLILGRMMNNQQPYYNYSQPNYYQQPYYNNQYPRYY